ncbi:MAG: hypothetical protein LBH93_05575 [Chitinispirillales bacterium]|jgi:hypothetical protein|nr:hypothetical protein [Chitinispirillales bacterium]
MFPNNDYRSDPAMREVYEGTDILRKPICGIVSGYHDLPYIMVAPSVEDGKRTAEVTGRICVSPKFVISAETLNDTFGDVFDPETFDRDIEGRLFSFFCANSRNVKVESKYFTIQHFDEPPRDYLERMADTLMSREDTRTGLIFNPNLRYYPVSIDKFIAEIVDREFRV